MGVIESFVKALDGKPVLIFGLGRSGMASAKALSDAGANVVVGDDSLLSSRQTEESGEILRSLGFTRDDIAGIEIFDLSQDDLSKYAFLLLSPGIPFTHPQPHDVVKKAQNADIEIICDIELFSRIYPDFKTIGITGTNGKSTTATLIQHILKEAGYKSQLGGNIGTPVFEFEVSDQNQWLVLEISSFQMDLCTLFRPDISIVLNLTPDHLDRHGDMDHYMEVKERITELSKSSEYNSAIICSDDDYTKKIYDRACELGLREIMEISTMQSTSGGVYIQGNMLFDDIDKAAINVGDVSAIESLRGVHNYQNIACAYAAMRRIGLAQDIIWDALNSFAGLNHRQYHVRTINGVDYINDSKATNAASSAVALGCRDNVYWIVGGKQKKNGLDGLEEFFPHIKHAFLIGESTKDFSAWFDKYGLEYSCCNDLEKAVSNAHEMAQENRGQPGGAGIVLLSPACASFDQFKSFEERGDKFTAIVKALQE